MGLFTRLAETIVGSAVNAGWLRTWMTEVERLFTSALYAERIYGALADLESDLAHGANSGAIVMGDSAANDGVYRKTGASGSGEWIRAGDLPGRGFVVASDNGGTADAIEAVTALPVNGSELITVPIVQTNTAAGPTVSFNGGADLTVISNAGNPVQPEGLLADSEMTGRISGSFFRLLSDQAVAAIQAAAEAAAQTATDKAAEAVAAAAGVNMPLVNSGDAGKFYTVKADETGAELSAPAVARGLLDVLAMDDTFVPTLTGGSNSVATLGQLIENTLVVPEMFGAVNSASATRASIQAMIDNAAERQCWLQRKQYFVDDELFFDDYTRIRGAGGPNGSTLRISHSGRGLAPKNQSASATLYAQLEGFWVYNNPSAPPAGSVGVELRNCKYCNFDIFVSGFAKGMEHFGDGPIGSYYNNLRAVLSSCTTGYHALGLVNTQKQMEFHINDVGTGILLSAGNGTHINASVEQFNVGVRINGPVTGFELAMDRIESSKPGATGIQVDGSSGASNINVRSPYYSTVATRIFDPDYVLSFNGSRRRVAAIASTSVPAGGTVDIGPFALSGLSQDVHTGYAALDQGTPANIVGPFVIVDTGQFYLRFGNLGGTPQGVPGQNLNVFFHAPDGGV